MAHLDALRLTADERSFLARLAKERALVTDRARLGAAAPAAGADSRGASPLRASLPDPIVAQPWASVSPPASPRGGAEADETRAERAPRANRGASPARFARIDAFGDHVAVASPRRRGGASAGGGAAIAALRRPSPARETRSGAPRERPTTAAARMGREHARDTWRRELGEQDGCDFDFDVPVARRAAAAAAAADPVPGPPTRDPAALEVRNADEAPNANETAHADRSNGSRPARPAPSPVSPARVSFERAGQPKTSARASRVPGGAARRAHRPEARRRGFGVSVPGVPGDARVVSRAETRAETSRDAAWEWQSSWQREWQTSLEISETRRRGGAAEANARAAASKEGRAASPVASVAAEPVPRLGTGSYRELRDARKASRAFVREDAGGVASTGLDVWPGHGGAIFH